MLNAVISFSVLGPSVRSLDSYALFPSFFSTTTMALNWTMLTPNRSPVPLPAEAHITTIDSGVELSLAIPDVPPSGNSAAGGSGGIKKLKSMGKIWLSDQRVRVGCPISSSVPLTLGSAVRLHK